MNKTKINLATDPISSIYCTHGPTLKFKRQNNKGCTLFYACSAYRDRKDCPFFLKEGEAQSEYSRKLWSKKYKLFLRKGLQHKRRYNFVKIYSSNTILSLCTTCNRFIKDTSCITEAKYDKVVHKLKPNCSLILIDSHLKESPSKYLSPLEKNTKEAQYFFSESSLKFLTNNILKMKYEKIICIGTPRLFEALSTKPEKLVYTNIFFLDFDPRFSNFWNIDQFAHYNMCNNHFFTPRGESHFKNFISKRNSLSGEPTKDILIVVDPPFGLLIEVMANSLKNLKESICEMISSTGETNMIDEILVNPYYMNDYINRYLLHLKMCDFMITYENHAKFSKEQSPVRIFTSIPLSKLQFPPDLGYKYCPRCQIYVHPNNRHCSACDKCTTVDGKRAYAHCTRCKICVKPYYLHCDKCHKCHPPNKHS